MHGRSRAIDRDGRNADRGGEKSEPGVDTHDDRGAGQDLGPFDEAMGLRRDESATCRRIGARGQAGGTRGLRCTRRIGRMHDAFGARAFARAAPGEGAGPAAIDALRGERLPIGIAPEFFGARGRAQKDRIRPGARQPIGPARRGRQTVARLAFGRITERPARERAIALDRRCFADARVLHAMVVEPARQAFAAAARRIPVARPMREPCEQSALEQGLRIDDRVVSDFAQRLLEGAEFIAHFGLPPRTPPAPPSHGNHALHARMQTHQARIGFFDHPIDLSVGMGTHDVGHHRQVVDHIAHGTGLDEKNAHVDRA